MLMPDHEIRRYALDHEMISPFAEGMKRPGVISYGVTSYGYDMRLDNQFRVFTDHFGSVVDPKNFDSSSFVEREIEVCIIPPRSFVLAQSLEYFRIPRHVLAVCLGKSTYARCGIDLNITPLEPEWEGTVTIEISNATPLPAKLYAGEGIAQVLFFDQRLMNNSEIDPSALVCKKSYKDKSGIYQGQRGVTNARVAK